MEKSEKFKANLLNVMKEKGISPSELARMMGTSPSTVSRWTSGSAPHARTLDKLEHLLRTPLMPTPEPPEADPEPVVHQVDPAITAAVSPPEAAALRALELAGLAAAVPKANTGLLLGAMWTGIGDVLAWRIPFDNQITDKLMVILTELASRAPLAAGYTPPVDPASRPPKDQPAADPPD